MSAGCRMVASNFTLVSAPKNPHRSRVFVASMIASAVLSSSWWPMSEMALRLLHAPSASAPHSTLWAVEGICLDLSSIRSTLSVAVKNTCSK